MEYEKQLEKLKIDLQKARDLKTRSEIALENLQKEEEQLINELKELGVSPDNLESEIKQLEEKIQKGIKEAEDLMPTEILESMNR